MTPVHSIDQRPAARLRGREPRSQNLSTKLTSEEAKAVEQAAARAGKTPSEWARELMLREASGADPAAPINFQLLLTEIVGTQLFLINVLKPIAIGQRITAEFYQEIIRHVRENKRAAAAELLERPAPTAAAEED